MIKNHLENHTCPVNNTDLSNRSTHTSSVLKAAEHAFLHALLKETRSHGTTEINVCLDIKSSQEKGKK